MQILITVPGRRHTTAANVQVTGPGDEAKSGFHGDFRKGWRLSKSGGGVFFRSSGLKCFRSDQSLGMLRRATRATSSQILSHLDEHVQGSDDSMS